MMGTFVRRSNVMMGVRGFLAFGTAVPSLANVGEGTYLSGLVDDGDSGSISAVENTGNDGGTDNDGDIDRLFLLEVGVAARGSMSA